MGATAYFVLDYRSLLADTELGLSARSMSDPLFLAGPVLQPIRGTLFGLVFYVLRAPFFGTRHGWLVMWFALVVLGIVGTFAGPPASIEGLIYTVLPLWLHATLLPELLLQSFLLSWVVFQWVRHPERRWMTWTMSAAFMLVMTLGVITLLGAVR